MQRHTVLTDWETQNSEDVSSPSIVQCYYYENLSKAFFVCLFSLKDVLDEAVEIINPTKYSSLNHLS